MASLSNPARDRHFPYTECNYYVVTLLENQARVLESPIASTVSYFRYIHMTSYDGANGRAAVQVP